MTPALELAHLTKRFGAIAACEDVSLSVDPGEVLAVAGENGAGKTTLMNLACGLYRPSAGRVFVRGQELEPGSPRQAIAAGLGMVHQHFLLVPPLTVAENVVLGAEPRRRGLLDRLAAEVAVEEISRRHGLTLDPRARVEDLSVAAQQRVEIARALYRRAEVLILDEPTALLAPAEAEALLAAVRSLASEGKSVILVSHKLGEVLSVAHRVAVLRQGRLVGERRAGETSARELAELMVGASTIPSLTPPPAAVASPASTSPPRIVLRSASALSDRQVLAFRDLELELFPGEILAIAGVDGNGQSELAEVIAELRPLSSGQLQRDEQPLRRESTAFIPADRNRFALCLGLSAEENLSLGRHRVPPFARGKLIDRAGRRAAATRLMGELGVRPPDPAGQAIALSGGNQQRLVLARELLGATPAPRLIVAVQPSRGLDLAAVTEVHRLLRRASDRGAAVLLVSLDLDEVRALGDRIGVMAGGRLVALLPRGADEAVIGRLMLSGEPLPVSSAPSAP